METAEEMGYVKIDEDREGEEKFGQGIRRVMTA
jgi:hypothetical protein